MMPARVNEAQALALALERLRRAADAMLNCLALGENLDTALRDLEAAYASSDQDTHTHLLWAQDVLDGKVKVKRKGGKRPETFDQVRAKALRYNIVVHFVRTLEGTEFAVYRNHTKVGHAKTEKRCMTIMRQLMKTT